jgi:hypothetical protein
LGFEKQEIMSIEICVALSKVNARPPLRALADVTLRSEDGEITIRRCAVFEKYGQSPWAILPRIPIDKNGKTNYVTLIDLPRPLYRRVLEAMLEEYKLVVDSRD